MTGRTYRATGMFVRAMQEALRIELRISGDKNIPDWPTLFVVNHFTRFETLLVPYAIYRATRRPVRTLAHDGLFRGAAGRYLRACGVMSTRDPHRNRTIIHELITGAHSWVIYPEGGLVKTKKTVDGRHLRLDLPHREGPPHTGAAVLALKSELCKRDYARACAHNDAGARERLEARFGLAGPESLACTPTAIVPVTVTYYPMRYDRRTLVRFAKLMRARLSPRAEEELLVEGTLLGDAETCVHFGEPIDVSAELPWTHEVIRHAAARLLLRRNEDYHLARIARRLTNKFMRRIYGSVEVNFDHLFATAIARCPADRTEVERVRLTTYLAAAGALASDRRCHPRLGDGLARLATGEPHDAYDDAEALALDEGIIARDGSDYVINHDALRHAGDFHDVRLNNMTGVIANELEPLSDLASSIERSMRVPMERLRTEVAGTASRRDHTAYREAHAATGERDFTVGEPFVLTPKRPRAGVVLVHGYLAAPAELRELAERLRDEGYLVYGTRLHGHGTSPDELREVSWTAWLDSIRRGLAAARASCQRVVVGGFSFGGILALLIAAAQGEQIAGVFTINAPLRLRDRRLALSTLADWADRGLRRFGLEPRHFSRSNAHTESPDINYTRDYLASLAEFRRAIGACRRSLSRIVAPALVIQSDHDPVVHPASARLIIESISSPDRRLLPIASDRHIVVRGPSADALARGIAEFVRRVAEPAPPAKTPPAA